MDAININERKVIDALPDDLKKEFAAVMGNMTIPSTKLIKAIFQPYPDVNYEYIMDGTGNPVIESNSMGSNVARQNVLE